MQKQDIESLEFELANIRLEADLKLAVKYPDFAGKPYPLGRCLEVRDEMFKLVVAVLKQNNRQLAPLREYMEHENAELKKVWGSLRDEYFQNALIVGDWYIDTANDTVNANKPRVEIKPLAASGFRAITSFEQFIKIAKPYWEVDIYQNTAFPALAPYLPFICVNHKGASWLAAANDDMIKLACDSDFNLSEQILAELPEPDSKLVQRWHAALAKLQSPDELLLQQGQTQSFCQLYRASNKASDKAFRDRVVLAFMSLPKGV